MNCFYFALLSTVSASLNLTVLHHCSFGHCGLVFMFVGTGLRCSSFFRVTDDTTKKYTESDWIIVSNHYNLP